MSSKYITYTIVLQYLPKSSFETVSIFDFIRQIKHITTLSVNMNCICYMVQYCLLKQQQLQDSSSTCNFSVQLLLHLQPTLQKKKKKNYVHYVKVIKYQLYNFVQFFFLSFIQLKLYSRIKTAMFLTYFNLWLPFGVYHFAVVVEASNGFYVTIDSDNACLDRGWSGYSECWTYFAWP